jgi:uncharacterized protein DUF3592
MRLLFFTIALFAVCVGLSLWVAVSESTRLNQSATWPKTDGTIVDSLVRDKGSQAHRRFCPYVIYRYTVAGVLYDSTSVRLDSDLSQCSADRQWANDIIRPYQNGSPVPVFYDPARPSAATLEIHKVPWLKLYPKTGLVASFIALMLVVRQLRSPREPRVPQGK